MSMTAEKHKTYADDPKKLKKFQNDLKKMQNLFPVSRDGFLHSGEEVFAESKAFAWLNNHQIKDESSEDDLAFLAVLKLKDLISEKNYKFEHDQVSSLIANGNNRIQNLLDFEFGKDPSQYYFDYMQESNRLALGTLDKYFVELETRHLGLSKPLRLLWDKRYNESDFKLLRSMLVRVGVELFAHKHDINWLEIPEFLELMAIAEMANVQTYTGNILYDQKNPDLDPLLILSATKLQQGFVIDRATDALFKLKNKLNLYDTQIQDCLKFFNDHMYLTDQGQFIDAFEPNLQISLESLSQSETEFLSLYSKRSYYMSGIFYGNLVKIGATLCGASLAQLHILDLWGKAMSDGLQTVNDLFDFLPFEIKHQGQMHKMYKQELNCPDLWNGKLTYPIFILLKSCSLIDRDWILSLTKYKQAGKYINKDENMRLVKLLFETGTFEKVKKYASKDVNTAKNALKIFPPSFARLILAHSTNICTKSKYFKMLEQLKQQ